MEVKRYTEQRDSWPKDGKVILAQYDTDSVTVYQAYNKSIGLYAARNKTFGGDFSFTRMTWIKPNFLWMMFRSGWGVKENQEVTLAIKIRKSAFERILDLAVPSTFDEIRYATRDEWQESIKNFHVRLQWDPDHDPFGEKENRRAIQLGLRNVILDEFVNDWIIDITDISEFVSEQREHVINGNLDLLYCPNESIYSPVNKALIKKLDLTVY